MHQQVNYEGVKNTVSESNDKQTLVLTIHNNDRDLMLYINIRDFYADLRKNWVFSSGVLKWGEWSVFVQKRCTCHLCQLVSELLQQRLPEGPISRKRNCLPFLLGPGLETRLAKCNATLFCCAFGNSTIFPILMTTQLLSKNCDGGHYSCSAPKDCCKQGCCFLYSSSSSHRPPAIQPVSMFNPLFLGHWYFWLAVTATIAGILCACSLWRRHSQGSLCCRSSGREDRASEPDSNGSCYLPPQYSRCNSFHQPPPPYSEVASKPDLYPLVINYNGDPAVKNNNTTTGYFMVQYFRNFIVRPIGSLSATSTIDSLSSSFICNATNEANTIIPPPYSCTGSLEEVTTDDYATHSSEVRQVPRSSSLLSGAESCQRSPSINSQISTTNNPQSSQSTPAHLILTSRPSSVVSIRDNPCFSQNTTNVHTTSETAPYPTIALTKEATKQPLTLNTNCDLIQPIKISKKIHVHKLPKDRSQDSESDEHNFSDLLNLSVCLPTSVINFEVPTHIHAIPHDLQYSVTNSMTGSDISSLANLGTPDSPPRATSPTVEMKQLLDKIQQLPQTKSPIPQTHTAQAECRPNRTYFHKAKAKTMYMPLQEGPNAGFSSRNSNTSAKIMAAKGWLSRSAPNTPCGNFIPSFPMHKKNNSCSHKNSKCKVNDGSPLLRENDESEEDNNKDERL